VLNSPAARLFLRDQFTQIVIAHLRDIEIKCLGRLQDIHTQTLIGGLL